MCNNADNDLLNTKTLISNTEVNSSVITISGISQNPMEIQSTEDTPQEPLTHQKSSH